MNSWQSMDDEARKRWWMDVARRMVAQYPLSTDHVKWLSYTHNAVFLVGDDDAQYILRIHKPDSIQPDLLHSEMMWLDHLSRVSDLLVPKPLQTRNGGLYAHELVDNVDAYAVLFRYLGGNVAKPKEITAEQIHSIGAMLAKLHLQAEGFTPPPEFNRPRLDWDGLLGSTSIYDPGENAGIFTDTQRDVFMRTSERVRETMEQLGDGAHEFGMIHGDLLCKNVLINHGQIAALDFEYCGFGYFLYDFTPILWQLKSERTDYKILEHSLWEGYASLRPMPETHRAYLETLVAGRQLASCYWLVNNLENPAIRAHAPALLHKRTLELEQFLQTGILHRDSETL